MNPVLKTLGMTKEKAISNLKHLVAEDEDIDYYSLDEKLSMELAIEVLNGGWIPVENLEGVPKDGEYLVTVDLSGETAVADIIWIETLLGHKLWKFKRDFFYGGWECWESDEVTPELAGKVIAYMPYPEPYKKD